MSQVPGTQISSHLGPQPPGGSTSETRVLVVSVPKTNVLHELSGGKLTSEVPAFKSLTLGPLFLSLIAC